MALSDFFDSIFEAVRNATGATTTLPQETGVVHGALGERGVVPQSDSPAIHVEPASEHDHAGESTESAPVHPDAEGWIRHPRVFVRPAHQGRWGGKISPACVVWHCTDMRPGSGPALDRARAASKGKGNAEHFVIWEDGTIVQHVPVTRNANHAGGEGAAKVNGYHVNSVSLGIELCNPGFLMKGKLDDPRLYCDDGPTVITEKAIKTESGWRVPYTKAQLDSAEWLARFVLPQCVTLGNGAPQVTLSWPGKPSLAVYRYGIRHSDINPTQKTDPGPLLDTKQLGDILALEKNEPGI